MRNPIITIIAFLLILSLDGQSCKAEVIPLSDHVSLIPGSVNGVDIEKDDAHLVIYGDPSGQIKKADMVLYTHSRRDVVWAGRELIEHGAIAVVPESDVEKFDKVEQFGHYKDCCEVLEAIAEIQCNVPCRLGRGCARFSCDILECCLCKGLQGCWECSEFEDCEKFETLKSIHGDSPQKNLKKIKELGLDSWADKRCKPYAWQYRKEE